MQSYHVPALAERSTELLSIKKDGIYADLTFGGGGHSGIILSRLGKKGRLYAFDQDPDAVANTIEDKRFTLIEGNFRYMRNYLRYHGVTELDGIIADLGVSSHHFDTPERGFSFRYDAPLDMRMNSRGGITAAEILNTYEKEDLIRIFRQYGEMQRSGALADKIVRTRETVSLSTTGQLIELARPYIPKKDENRHLSKLFQALRIEVNGEVESLKMALEQGLKLLRPGGRFVVISYHSLEDRLVKNFFRSGNFDGSVDKDFYGNMKVPFEIITRKPILPDQDEILNNPRSRSAKLRAASKI